MKEVKLIIVLFLLIPATYAQQAQRLNANWQFIKQDLSTAWEAVRPVEGDSAEIVPLWQPVTLPHCYNAEDAVDPDVNYYQGPAWYRTVLDINNPYPNGNTLLHFEGAGQKTEVYIYDQKVGSHVGGYDEWTVDITQAVADFKKKAVYNTRFKHKIPIVIRTDNSRDREMIPSSLSDFNVYGGLYRYVNLVYNPPLSVEKLFIKTHVSLADKLGSLQVTPRFYNPDHIATVSGTLRVYGPDGKLVLEKESGEKAVTETAFWNLTIKSPRLWSPQTPALYTVKASFRSAVGEITHTEKIGFKDVIFKEQGPFFLNGERLLLRGTHRHEDHAGVGAAMTEDMIRTEMKLIKAMGVNFIRLAHYQQSQIVLNLCDSLGILVWEEIPWCRGGLGGPVYQEQAKRMLTNMIEQHYDHPSVMIWGLGNENDWPGDFQEFDKQKIRTFMKELNDLAHRLDPSRKTAIRRCDFCKDIVDVYSPSIWAGWYRGLYKEYKTISEAEMKQVNHFLHVEWGGDSHAGRHAENPYENLPPIKTGNGGAEKDGDALLNGGPPRIAKDGDWSETYVCDLIDWHLKEQETMPWLNGTAYWCFKDFSTPLRPENPVPYVNQKGVVERDFTKKEAYYVFQSYWTEKAMVHIYGHTWPVRWGKPDEEKQVKVYSNCDEVELFLNGKSMGKRKRHSQDFPAAGLRWNLYFREGENKIHVTGFKDKALVRDTITFTYQTQKWGKPATIKLEKVIENDDTVKVNVTLTDANGVPCLDAKNYLYFSLAGDGKLIKNLGTPTGSSKVQAFNGRGSIRVQTGSGINTIIVKSDGLKTATLTF
ncbi:glycoside hydrolase family 2 protein (plasmid) [Pedobacter sp. BS3]|uniref:glycoside hydrolase family 2 TIM barrel-domain containing protein n=1 Tax=Pedobacter sp. BS3 TaxID=2567937 RepID=UPI0011EF7328|nr:glycoside hydrolase family 2 TIM barrel-domain containing protein [Pedobacter sp. BS3]TZF86273.1 glycoside hydrolase family 2 protein [Pedobacter sp. BS3]